MKTIKTGFVGSYTETVELNGYILFFQIFKTITLWKFGLFKELALGQTRKCVKKYWDNF